MSQSKTNIRDGLIWISVFAVILIAVFIMREYSDPLHEQPKVEAHQQVEGNDTDIETPIN